MAKRSWIVVLSLILILGFYGLGASARAAGTGQFAVTWRASHSYVPSGYSGKALSTMESQITASVEAFAGNQRSDLSNMTIYWYLNDTLLGGGPGARSMTFSLFGGSTDSETLRVEAPDYPGGLLMASTPIPIAQPTVVIDAPYASGIFSANPLVVDALPYFFEISSPTQLGFAWSVNGEQAANAENPDTLQVALGSGTRAGSALDVQLTVTNAADSTTAGDEKNLTYQPLP